ncbi:MAG: type II toxin-antitoxin system RelE/ParE family toxin [Cyclobacteriaceae bacterium]
MKRKSVKWTNRAVESLDLFCAHIHKDSPAAASRVKKEIIQTAKKLSANPEMYQLDDVFAGTELNIRRFFRWSYKIVYQVLDNDVVILDVFHTSMGDSEEE